MSQEFNVGIDVAADFSEIAIALLLNNYLIKKHLEFITRIPSLFLPLSRK